MEIWASFAVVSGEYTQKMIICNNTSSRTSLAKLLRDAFHSSFAKSLECIAFAWHGNFLKENAFPYVFPYFLMEFHLL